jgi:hypothetical protein
LDLKVVLPFVQYNPEITSIEFDVEVIPCAASVLQSKFLNVIRIPTIVIGTFCI